MKHQIKLLSISAVQSPYLISKRIFKAKVDGIIITGTITLTISASRIPKGYAFRFDDKSIAKHSDYKNIRRQLLLMMIARNIGMLPASRVVK